MPESLGCRGGGRGHDFQYNTSLPSLWVIPEFEKIFSIQSLFRAWREFVVGKHKKSDVADFSACLIDNIFILNRDIISGTYRHSGYTYFKINDQKPREIHKASVRDRIVHHALYRALYPYFDRKFIFDSYSCRLGKGTHRALRRFADFARRESRNYGRTCWVLSCDIRKCFASVDHGVLKKLLAGYISCPRIRAVTYSVIGSFHTSRVDTGIPLGNLTSQIFINIYLNELDQCLKRLFKTRYYIRYADDFVIMSYDRDRLRELLPKIGEFLEERLSLQLRANNWPIRSVASGVDFLGWVHFSDHRVLRNTTKWRMIRRLEQRASKAALSSYRGLLGHGNAHGLRQMLDLKYGK